MHAWLERSVVFQAEHANSHTDESGRCPNTCRWRGRRVFLLAGYIWPNKGSRNRTGQPRSNRLLHDAARHLSMVEQSEKRWFCYMINPCRSRIRPHRVISYGDAVVDCQGRGSASLVAFKLCMSGGCKREVQ